jgi:hypothetical protein
MKTKKILFTIAVCSVMLFFIAFACSEVDNENNGGGTGADAITFIETELSGCNNDNEKLSKSSIRASSEEGDTERDTVIITETNDSIRVYVGHNYDCGAPFVADYEIKEDSVFMYITDTCANVDCYERCFCCYKFDFLFKKQGEREYGYKIVLTDPRKTDQKILSEGILKELSSE